MCVCLFVRGLSEVRFKVKEVFVCCSVASGTRYARPSFKAQIKSPLKMSA